MLWVIGRRADMKFEVSQGWAGGGHAFCHHPWPLWDILPVHRHLPLYSCDNSFSTWQKYLKTRNTVYFWEDAVLLINHWGNIHIHTLRMASTGHSPCHVDI